MNKRRMRFTPTLSTTDGALESRIVLSGNVLHKTAALIAAKALQNSGTTTNLNVSSGTLGQPIVFTVSVKANSAKSGPPTGTVSILDRGTVIQTVPVTSSKATNGKLAISQATLRMTPVPGGGAYYFGQHTIIAVFNSRSRSFKTSASVATFNITQPDYTTLATGTKVAAIAPGSGPQIQPGQTANVLYTGYLASNGQIFDNSLRHGTSPLTFRVGAGQVVPGFDAGTSGMQVGESRIVVIPPSEGYGAIANGSIPANSTLVFVVTLQSIS